MEEEKIVQVAHQELLARANEYEEARKEIEEQLHQKTKNCEFLVSVQVSHLDTVVLISLHHNIII